jgi:uncharacterized protein YejL (UPF0352 family)
LFPGLFFFYDGCPLYIANDQPIQSAATVNTLLQVLERHGAAQDDLRHAILAALAAVLMNCELAAQTA